MGSNECSVHAKRPLPHQGGCPVVGLEKMAPRGDIDEVASLDEEDDHHGHLGPFGKALPHGLVKRIADLLNGEDPYVEREIAERSTTCPRYQFLKQCQKGHVARCADIWETSLS